ncbi:MAG: urate hydroxylase PuuD [Nitratireductor sp.]
MYEYAIILEWLNLAARWLHIITAVAWIGSSFYFIALDLGLRQDAKLPKGAFGEEWQVHGGGFYHIQKYLVAPAKMPEHLTWFKWESYATWISGFALLCLLYYAGADIYMVDPNVADISANQSILISIATIVVGWILYDQLCKSKFGENSTLLMVFLFIIIVAVSWGYTQVFTGRAAMLHVGIFTATIMSGNVIFIIIPNQKIVVADLIAGKKPDAKYGKIAKQRSTHNNYLTLPVIFMMLSNHYPLAFATEYNWIIASLVFLMGVTIRHYFNTKHARKGSPNWTWLLTAILFVLIMWLSTVKKPEPMEQTKLSNYEQQFAQSDNFDQIVEIVQNNCSMCHAAQPSWEGIHRAPKNVKFDAPQQIAKHARAIYINAGASTAMPPPSLSKSGIALNASERQLLEEWYKSATSGT